MIDAYQITLAVYLLVFAVPAARGELQHESQAGQGEGPAGLAGALRKMKTVLPSSHRGRSRPGGARRVLEAVIDTVAAEAGLSRDELLSRSRIQRTAWPRNVAYWCAFQLLSRGAAQIVLGLKLAPMSQVEIARVFGRDRSAVVYGAATVDAMVTIRPEVRRAVERVLEKIRASL